MVVSDGDVAFESGQQLITTLDNLIADGRIPPVIAVHVGSGG